MAALSWRRKPAVPRRSSREGEEPLGVSMRRPYVRALVALFLVGGVTSGVLDYEFKLALQELSADPRRLTRLLGAFYGGQNLLALVSQIGLSTWVLSRFGVRGASAASLVLTAGAVWHYSISPLERHQLGADANLLLLQTSMPIMAISTACGFQSPPHFSKCYRKHFGHPPTVERMARRGNIAG